jgi:glycosyltransferase involved in cell wall biosynthesis
VEIVVVNDGSTDGSQTIVDEFAKCHPVTLLSFPKPTGKASCLNAAAGVARGEFLIILDQDDMIGDFYIEKMREALSRYPFVAARLEYNELNPAWLADAFRNSPNQDKASIALYGEGGRESLKVRVAPGCALGIRLSTLTSLGGFSTSVRCADDLDLCLRAEFAGIPHQRVENALLHYRFRSTPRDIFLQRYGYGSSWVALYKKHRGAGMRRPGMHQTAQELLSALRGLLSASRVDRAIGSARLGFTLGRIGGSVKYRAYYI